MAERSSRGLKSTGVKQYRHQSRAWRETQVQQHPASRRRRERGADHMLEHSALLATTGWMCWNVNSPGGARQPCRHANLFPSLVQRRPEECSSERCPSISFCACPKDITSRTRILIHLSISLSLIKVAEAPIDANRLRHLTGLAHRRRHRSQLFLRTEHTPDSHEKAKRNEQSRAVSILSLGVLESRLLRTTLSRVDQAFQLPTSSYFATCSPCGDGQHTTRHTRPHDHDPTSGASTSVARASLRRHRIHLVRNLCES